MNFFPFGKVDVYAYAFENGMIYAQSESPLALKVHSVRVRLPRAEKFNTKLKVVESVVPCVESCRLLEALYKKVRSNTYKMALAKPGEFASYLEMLLPPLPSSEDRRTEFRRKTNQKATSRFLPNYSAQIIDISPSGLCLATTGPLEKGLEFPLRLELDSDHRRRVDCLGKVCWVAQSRNWVRVGVSFIDGDAVLHSAIRTYLEWAQKIDEGKLGANEIRG